MHTLQPKRILFMAHMYRYSSNGSRVYPSLVTFRSNFYLALHSVAFTAVHSSHWSQGLPRLDLFIRERQTVLSNFRYQAQTHLKSSQWSFCPTKTQKTQGFFFRRPSPWSRISLAVHRIFSCTAAIISLPSCPSRTGNKNLSGSTEKCPPKK